LNEDPLGFEAGVNFYTYVQNNPINFNDPMGLKTGVIITTDYIGFVPIGSHAAVYIENNGDPAIYDPAGSYGNRASIGSGDLITGDAANLTEYSKYHMENGSKVSVIFFNTSATQESSIYSRAEEMGGGVPGLCALYVSNVIKGIGPFESLGTRSLPDTLNWALTDLQNNESIGHSGTGAASGGFVLYPNKPNTNMMQGVYSK
jgi:hypothetical protein